MGPFSTQHYVCMCEKRSSVQQKPNHAILKQVPCTILQGNRVVAAVLRATPVRHLRIACRSVFFSFVSVKGCHGFFCFALFI